MCVNKYCHGLSLHKNTSLLLLVMLLMANGLGATPSIDLLPSANYIVFQNDTPAMFYCYGNGLAIGSVVSWTLNGTGYNAQHIQRGITVFTDTPHGAEVSSRLSIPSNSSINNNTQMVCRSADATFNNIQTSQPSNLTIQGSLDAPSNFSVNIYTTYNTTLFLSWGAPFSLDVTNSPDIFYYTLCTNITTYGCRNISSDPDCTFPRTCTSSVDFTHSSPNGTIEEQNKTIMDYGDTIQFIFFAVNGAGNGSMATIMFQPLKRDEKLATSEMKTRSHSDYIFTTTTTLPSNEQKEISTTLIALVIFVIFVILIIIILIVLCMRKYFRKYFITCSKPSTAAESNVPQPHENSTPDPNHNPNEKLLAKTNPDMTSEKSSNVDIVCHPICAHYSDVIAKPKSEKSCYTDVAFHPYVHVFIPVPHQKIQCSEVTNNISHCISYDSKENDSTWCHQPDLKEQVTTAHTDLDEDLNGKSSGEKSTTRILSEDIEQRETYINIIVHDTNCNIIQGKKGNCVQNDCESGKKESLNILKSPTVQKNGSAWMTSVINNITNYQCNWESKNSFQIQKQGKRNADHFHLVAAMKNMKELKN